VGGDKKADMQEIERKFIIQSIPFPLDQLFFEHISQGYLVTSEKGDEVRVRQRGEHCFLTVKKGEGFERYEMEIEISRDQFEKLYGATTDERVEKKRYIIKDRDCTIELDIFEGRLRGLMVAEVEFRSLDEGKAYRTPEWFGREVTEDKRFANRNLAKHGLPLLDS
jgi:adenylate cyclase